MSTDTLAGAVCAQVDPYVWFSEKGHLNAAAKEICHSCLVEDACLSTALSDLELSGIWGGTTQSERQRMRIHPVRPINHGTEAGAQAHRRRSETVCLPCKAAESTARKRRSVKVEEMAA